jgi:hypothetical protein
MSSQKRFSAAIIACVACTLFGLLLVAGIVVRGDDQANAGGDENPAIRDEENTAIGDEEDIATSDAEVAKRFEQEAEILEQAADKNEKYETKSIKLAGKGRQASDKFDLASGLGVFEINHDGSSNLVVRLLDANGDEIDTLFNQVGEFKGEQGFAIPVDGQYLLDIAANGNWTVAIRQPRPSVGDTLPRTLEGSGYAATSFVQLDKGLHVFHMTHAGQDRFKVTLVDRHGHPVESLVNVLGTFDGSKPLKIQKSGIYFLNVTGDGDWTIDVQ